MEPVQVKSSEAAVTISPAHGASILSFSVGGTQILRAGADSPDPRTLACFPLLPYCNRVEHGVFEWLGERVELGRTLPDEQHALHGDGWLGRWELDDRGPNWVQMGFTHPAGVWPWRYRAEQTVTVEPTRLTVALGLVNLSTRPMPAGVGFHPYFARPARFTATLDGVWRGPNLIPDTWDDHSGFRNQDVDAVVFDNTFTGWDGKAVIETSEGRVELASDLPLLHVYTPRGRGMFCLEPVTAAPDALNHPERGLRILAPGESVTGSMTITVGA